MSYTRTTFTGRRRTVITTRISRRRFEFALSKFACYAIPQLYRVYFRIIKCLLAQMDINQPPKYLSFHLTNVYRFDLLETESLARRLSSVIYFSRACLNLFGKHLYACGGWAEVGSQRLRDFSRRPTHRQLPHIQFFMFTTRCVGWRPKA